ncbi:MAG TPA: ChaN family lipoprotein, partial [Longimicrobiales bacterium]|nr:ChaN family lipoprotein [Longimicrobiales bacterium]
MRHVILFSAVLLTGGCASASPARVHPPASPEDAETEASYLPPAEGVDFAVFRGDGTPATLDEVVREAGNAEVVLFGEEHDDLMTHRLQVEVLRRLFAEYQAGPMAGSSPHGTPGAPGVSTPATGGDRAVVLSMEMFERDVQYVVDEYLADLITESHFETSARAWPHYEERYRDIVEFAKAHGLPLVAANAPRRYVNRASRLGRESLAALPASALATLPPLPYPQGSPTYRTQWDEIMEGAPESDGTPFDGQTLWDAAMAWSIAEALDGEGNPLVLHLAGSFHVARFTGIPEALEHYRPGTEALVVVGRPAEDLGALPEEHVGDGDF